MKTFKNLNLKEFNSYRIESVGSEVFFPESEEDLVELYTVREDYILLGSGHNIILSKPFYDQPIIIFNGNFNSIKLYGPTGLEVQAGAMMHDVAKTALDKGLSCLEIFHDIPSSLGGAIVMNAGASGEEIKDVLVKVRYLDLFDMNIKEILKDEMSFNYRDSFFQRNTDKIILKAWLKLEIGVKEEIEKKMETLKAQRWAKQPKQFPNAGSVFKRPKGYYVGAIIDELELKGYTVGGAKISERHGGFIINFNDAKGEDIISIINEVKSRVWDRFQVDLEVEQRII